MKKKHMLSLSILLLFIFPNCTPKVNVADHTKGYLLIIGGGNRPDFVMKKFIELANGFKDGKIVILPMASSVPDEVGLYQQNELMALGARNVSYLIINHEEAQTDSAANLLENVSGVFFSGGDQSRLIEVLGGTLFEQKIKTLYQNGAIIGGTSAGAAVMSEIMITGDEKKYNHDNENPFSTIEPNNIVIATGFGFLKNVVIDQHFVRRKRHNRLISLTLEHPDKVGIGIDEATAILVYPNMDMEIMGENSVIFYDARNSEVWQSDTTRTSNLTVKNLKMHILTNGYRINLLTNKIQKIKNGSNTK